MNKPHKTQKELEKIIIKKELALCNSLKKDIHLYEKVNEISSNINKKRERESSRSPPSTHQTPSKSSPLPKIDIHITLTKLFEIASKQTSFSKTMTLLNCLIIKAKSEQPQYKLSFLIKIFYLIMTSPHKNNPITITSQYKELFANAESIITNEDKEHDEGLLYDVFLSFGLLYSNEYALYQDDSFLFNATTKVIGDTLDEIAVPSANAENMVVLMEKELMCKKSIVVDRKVVDELKRKMCFDMIKGMAKYAKLAMKGHVKLFCRNVMLNYQMKLNEDMKKTVIELINELACKAKGSSISGIVRDDKIKVTPGDNYYQVSDARDEKILVSNYDKWESKQNGIESTKQYFG